MRIKINETTWTPVELPAGYVNIFPQSPNGFYLSEEPVDDINSPNVIKISTNIVYYCNQPKTLYFLSLNKLGEIGYNTFTSMI